MIALGVACVAPEDSLQEAATRMNDNDVGALIVERDGRMVGIITERDLLRAVAMRVKPESSPVAAFMASDPKTAAPEDDCGAIAARMLEHHVRHLPVVAGDAVVDVVSARDMLMLEASRPKP